MGPIPYFCLLPQVWNACTTQGDYPLAAHQVAIVQALKQLRDNDIEDPPLPEEIAIDPLQFLTHSFLVQ
jgi:hypothetical protein